MVRVEMEENIESSIKFIFFLYFFTTVEGEMGESWWVEGKTTPLIYKS